MTAPGALRYTVHDALPAEDARLVDIGLGEANDAAAPLHEVRALGCFARLASGAVVGGAVGRTRGTCCELQQLWVEPARRRHGIGRQLVRAFEARALERGCRCFYLETFSFQAPTLYLSMGYRIKLEVAGFPAGIVKFTMVREAEPSEAMPAGNGADGTAAN